MSREAVAERLVAMGVEPTFELVTALCGAGPEVRGAALSRAWANRARSQRYVFECLATAHVMSVGYSLRAVNSDFRQSRSKAARRASA